MIEQSPHHAACRPRLDALWEGDLPFGVSDIILSAVVRVATNPRVFSPTPSTDEAFGQNSRQATASDGTIIVRSPLSLVGKCSTAAWRSTVKVRVTSSAATTPACTPG